MNESSNPRPGKRRTISIGKSAETADDSHVADAPELDLGETMIQPAEVKPDERRAHRTLQLGFFVTVVVGMVTAASGTIEGLGALGFGGPLASIIGFYIFGSLQGFTARSDTRQQFADSCYFLGFLLTMIALLVGFLPAGLFGQEITSQGILRHFSMALGATALGLVCRILVLQGGRSLGEIAADVEATLTQYAQQVSDEAKSIVGELAVVRTELESQREHVASLVTVDLKTSFDAAFKPIIQMTAEISSSLGTQTEQITKAAERLQTALSQSAAQIIQADDLRESAATTVEQTIASVSQSLKQFESQMGRLRDELSKVVTASTTEISNMTSAFEAGTRLAPALGPAIEQIEEGLNDISATINNVQRQSKAVGDRLSSAFERDSDMLGGVEEAGRTVVANLHETGRTATDGIREESARVQEQLSRTRTELGQTLQLEAEQFKSEISHATDRLAEVLSTFAARIEGLSHGDLR